MARPGMRLNPNGGTSPNVNEDWTSGNVSLTGDVSTYLQLVIGKVEAVREFVHGYKFQVDLFVVMETYGSSTGWYF